MEWKRMGRGKGISFLYVWYAVSIGEAHGGHGFEGGPSENNY